MGRTLKRVELDFDWPLNKIWAGYINPYTYLTYLNDKYSLHTNCTKCENWKVEDPICTHCDGDGRIWATKELKEKATSWTPFEPPEGPGYQLWETTSEGSPVSPVFETLDELCKWCEDNATTFANFKTTADEWKKMLSADNVHHQRGNMVFV